MDGEKDYSWLIESRPAKPREEGLTMVIGDGPYFIGGIHDIENLLNTAGDWVDWYKFTWASLPLQPKSVLDKKLSILNRNDTLAFTGGNFLEAAVAKNKSSKFLEMVQKSGCPGVEVSSTVVEMSTEEKTRLVAEAAGMGFHVHAEIGEKPSETGSSALPPEQIIDEAKSCLQAGAEMIILETEEISQYHNENSKVSGEECELATDQLHDIVHSIGIENIMFEVPLAGYYEVMSASSWFINTFGPNVNLGNVNPAHVLLVEQQRRGIGPHSL